MADDPQTPHGIYPDVTNEAYHAGPGISKTGLWTIHTKTPYHFRFAPRQTTQAMTFGSAVHYAVLEPHKFDQMVKRGPEDRRGNRWKGAQDEAANAGLILVTGPEHDTIQAMRDAAHANPIVRKLATPEAQIEASAYWTDPSTGVLCRCRPDLWHPGKRILADYKTASTADAWTWGRDAAKFGYHLQEFMYTEGWEQAGGGEVDGFVFIVQEKEPPYAVACYEFEPTATTEGGYVYRHALGIYKSCLDRDEWPGYQGERGVDKMDIPGWAYRFSQAAAA